MPLPAGRLGLATVQSASPGRAPLRCVCLTQLRGHRRCSTTQIWCRRRGWSQSWRWPNPRACEGWPSEHLSVPTDRGVNAGLKVASLVVGMVAGTDSIDDMALLRQGAWTHLFDRVTDPPTPPRPDHPAARAVQPETPRNTRTARSGALPHPASSHGHTPGLTRMNAVDRWIRAKACCARARHAGLHLQPMLRRACASRSAPPTGRHRPTAIRTG
jgi:hypothetical protein